MPRVHRTLLLIVLLTFVAATSPAQTIRLRLTAANLTSGNNQAYDSGEGLRILDGLNPDVVMVQEFNYLSNSNADFRSLVDTAFGASFSYYRQPGGLQIPNGIISRYPILSAGVWDDVQVSNRDFVWARIDIPGPIDLWAISVHLLTASASVRDSEADALLSFINSNVPSAAYLAIGGDFNTDTRSESALSTLGAIVKTTGPYPVDQNNNANTNAGRAKPYDGVYVDSDLQTLATSVVVGASTYANGLVTDTRVYTPIAELSPARSSDSAATNMQHMAVVKDFLITTSVPEPGSVSLILLGTVWLVARRRARD